VQSKWMKDQKTLPFAKPERKQACASNLSGLVTTLGGPRFRVRYRNGDETAYVTIVYDARVTGGEQRADGEEVLALGWFGRSELETIELGTIAHATFEELGWITP
jgi:hypothetical protein